MSIHEVTQLCLDAELHNIPLDYGDEQRRRSPPRRYTPAPPDSPSSFMARPRRVVRVFCSPDKQLAKQEEEEDTPTASCADTMMQAAEALTMLSAAPLVFGM